MIGRLKLVGLTGGIGTGKSTVAGMIRDLGLPVLDADVLAREVARPGQPAHREIAATWPDVVAPDGTIDRKLLATRVFADEQARRVLEAITHPRIAARARSEAERLAADGHSLAFYEASLLVETGRHREHDGLVVVVADEAQQLARVVARDRVTPEHALARLRAQSPLAAKIAVATHVIDNSAGLEATRRQVEALVAALRS